MICGDIQFIIIVIIIIIIIIINIIIIAKYTTYCQVHGLEEDILYFMR